MYQIVRNRDSSVYMHKVENIEKAKEYAQFAKSKTNDNYTIYETKVVWTTETLDEACK